MLRIMVLNAKGGCGKTMLATNLASYYASQGVSVTLMDRDPITASSHWLQQRSENLPPIYLITSTKPVTGVTRTWAMRVPQETERLIIDTPAGVDGTELENLLHMADVFLIPVLPSETDIFAASRFIFTLFMQAGLSKQDKRFGIIANRVRNNTVSTQHLNEFLEKLDYPLLTSLRDTQNYIHAASEGMGIFEAQPTFRYMRDIENWKPLLEWVEQFDKQKKVVPFSPRLVS